MHLEFAYKPEDFQESSRAVLNARKSQPSGSRRGLLGWVIFVALAVMIFMWLQRPQGSAPGAAPRPPQAPDDPWTIMAPLAPWIILVIVLRICGYWSARKGPRPWIRNPELLEPRFFDIDDQSLSLGEGGLNTQWKWDAFDGWSETANLFLIKLKDKRHLIVPKRALTPQQQEELGRLLSVRAVPPTQGFPVIATAGNATINPPGRGSECSINPGPCPGIMHWEFTFTPQDYRDLSGAALPHQIGRSPLRKRHGLILSAIAISTLAVGMIRPSQASDAAERPPLSALSTAALSTLPWLILVSTFVAMIIRPGMRRSLKHRRLDTLLWTVWICILLTSYVLAQLHQPPRVASTNATSARDLFENMTVPVVSWLLFCGFIWFLVVRNLKTGWRTIPYFLDPRRVDMDSESLTVTEPVARIRWTWKTFNGWMETPSLFVLHLRHSHFMIPKRVVTGEQQDEIRELFARNIVSSKGRA